MTELVKRYILYIAFFQALIATLSSLILSEVLHLPPCVLCWYQRILMYPLVIILGVGILKKDKNVGYLGLPFSILGMIVASYHYLLQIGIIPENIAPCQQGISCTTTQIELLGFITIPFMAFLGFTAITICLAVFQKDLKK